MTVVTKYDVGDKVFTVEKKSLKVREFEIGSVFVSSITKDKARVKYLAKDDSIFSEGVPEEHCFSSQQELLTHVTTI